MLNWGKPVAQEVADFSALRNRLENQIMFRIPSLAPIFTGFSHSPHLFVSDWERLLRLESHPAPERPLPDFGVLAAVAVS
jgi:hypothetical protein